jgi:hypothetical protein
MPEKMKKESKPKPEGIEGRGIEGKDKAEDAAESEDEIKSKDGEERNDKTEENTTRDRDEPGEKVCC